MLPTVERRLVSRIHDRPPTPAKQRRPRIPVGIRAAYGVVAAVGLWLLLCAVTPRPNLASAQATVQVLGSLLLLVLGTAVGLGLCRVAVVRHACTLTGTGLMLSPLFLPGAAPNALIFGGLLAFGVSGWASDALELRGRADPMRARTEAPAARSGQLCKQDRSQ
jgi:hypothetical protein